MSQFKTSLFDAIFGDSLTTDPIRPNRPTLEDLIARKKSVILCDGKLYQVTVEEVEVTKKA